MPGLKSEIEQRKPFSSVEEEALLNLMRTADCLQRVFQKLSREWGVTSTQYNVLRILRGAHPAGLTCSQIGQRMITADPDITRLLGRLKVMKLVKQHKDRQDRRVVWTQISAEGLELLSSMDPAVQQAPKRLLGHMSEVDVTELTRLLEKARTHCGGPLGEVRCEGSDPVSCDGAATGQVSCDGVHK